MAVTEFGKQMGELTTKFLRGELERDAFLKQERERVRAAILELSHVPKLCSYVCFLLHCRKQARHDSTAKHVLVVLYRYLILDDGHEGRAGKDERFEEFLRNQCHSVAMRDSLPWSCGVRVRNNMDEHWYAPVLLKGLPITNASEFAVRVFMTSPRLLRNVLLEFWRGDASVTSTTDGRLKRCGSFLAELREEVPANTQVSIKMELDESACGDHCKESTNKIYAPMKICLLEVRKGVCLWEAHWHLKFSGTTGLASGSSDPAAPWVGLDVLMKQALHWLKEWEGSKEEEEAVIIWLWRAEQVKRKQDELWLRHVLDVLLIELRKHPKRYAVLLSRAHSDIKGDNTRVEAQDDSLSEILRPIFSDYEERRAERPADYAESVTELELIVALLQAMMADEEHVDGAAEKFAEIVAAMIPRDVTRPKTGRSPFTRATARKLDSSGIVMARQGQLRLRVELLLDTFDNFVKTEPERMSDGAREDIKRWIASATNNLGRGQSERALMELFELLRRWPSTAAFVLARGFLRSIEASAHVRSSHQELLDNFAREEDESAADQATYFMYRALHEIYLSRRAAGIATDEEKVFLLLFIGALQPSGEQVVMQLLTAQNDDGFFISDITDLDRSTIHENVIESGVEKHIFRHVWVEEKSHEISSLVKERNYSPTVPEPRPDAQHSEQRVEPDGDILSLLPEERDRGEPGVRR